MAREVPKYQDHALHRDVRFWRCVCVCGLFLALFLIVWHISKASAWETKKTESQEMMSKIAFSLHKIALSNLWSSLLALSSDMFYFP